MEPGWVCLDLEQDEDLQRHMEAIAWGLTPEQTEPDPRYADAKGATHRYVYYGAYELSRVPAFPNDAEEWGW